MQHVISGVTRFQNEVFPSKRKVFQELANGQSPEVLFITCSDSRIDPNLVTQTNPGELFICRNAGNIVPPHSQQTGGMTASIEFAVAGLGVEHIVICGHTDCGAMKGALAPEKLDEMPHVKEWLGHCRCASAVLKEKHGALNSSHLDLMTQENVIQQLQHLKTHPSVAAKLATNQLQLHGWVYDIGSGAIYCYDEATRSFIKLENAYETNQVATGN